MLSKTAPIKPDLHGVGLSVRVPVSRTRLWRIRIGLMLIKLGCRIATITFLGIHDKK